MSINFIDQSKDELLTEITEMIDDSGINTDKKNILLSTLNNLDAGKLYQFLSNIKANPNTISEGVDLIIAVRQGEEVSLD